jgi:hypothetical protein
MTMPTTISHDQCRCNHDAGYLHQEIAAGRYVQEWRKRADGEYVPICRRCNGLWDHRATDRLIERVQSNNWKEWYIPLRMAVPIG